MGILHRYILKELFYWFGLILGIFAVIVFAKELNDIRDEIMDQNASTPALVVIQYMALNSPGLLAEAIPLIALFSVLFAIGMMAKNREMIAMVSTGVSFGYLAVPPIIFGLTVTVGALALAEYVVPMSESRAKFLYDTVINGDNVTGYFSNDDVFRKGPGKRFYIVANFNSETDVMGRPTIIDVNETGDGLKRRIEGRTAKLAPESEGSKKKIWEFDGAEEWLFTDDGASVTLARHGEGAPYRDPLEEKLDSFLTREKSPKEMSLTDLYVHASILARQGGSPQLPKFQTNFQSGLAMPFACLMLTLLAFAIAADVQRRNFILVFTLGLGFGVGYYLVHETLKGMGVSGTLSEAFGSAGPIIAGWGAAGIYAGISAWLVRRLSTVH